jgi:asparagine synthase (glutamine-hydrolysing)
VEKALSNCTKPGVLLSGGIDSSVLALLANDISPVPCFVIGDSLSHPDVVAACRLAHEMDWDLYIYLPNTSSKEKAALKIPNTCLVDDAVYLALEFVSHFATDVLAGDGIDEQMGGYWWHTHESDRFQNVELAFKYFWGELETKHLQPMFNSAAMVGINIDWVYLHSEVVDYIARIPLADRVKGGVPKYIWRQLAREIGVPEWVIERPKIGFVHALRGVI